MISKMSKFVCIVLCVVAASLTKVSAVTEEEKAAFHEVITPIMAECSKEHGVSDDDIKAATEAKNVDGVKSCFLSCVFKKAEVMDDKGLFDVEKGLSQLKEFVKGEEDLAKYEEIAKVCASVNDQEVSDCDRAKLLLACAFEHKAEILV